MGSIIYTLIREGMLGGCEEDQELEGDAAMVAAEEQRTGKQ
jgi:hypothetical protein